MQVAMMLMLRKVRRALEEFWKKCMTVLAGKGIQCTTSFNRFMNLEADSGCLIDKEDDDGDFMGGT
jgi:hypothetical protein